MTVKRPWLTLQQLVFTGENMKPTALTFGPGLNVLYGASNAGKSFSLKAIDFMLGSSRKLPDITERRPYDRAWLGLTLPKSRDVTLMRALAGGSFSLHAGIVVDSASAPAAARPLSGAHDHTNTDNLSQFLLDEIGLSRCEVAVDANGKKRTLSFRDLVRYCIVDETAMQSEVSPALSGQHIFATAERSVFKLLLTGIDDRAITPVVDRKTFKASTNGKLEVLDDMIASIERELEADYPQADQLEEQRGRLEENYQRLQRDVERARESIRSLLAERRELADRISRLGTRRAEIHVNVGRFEQLQEVYQSDIQRLEAIEEAGFLLSLGSDHSCPLCGASPEHQQHSHGLVQIEATRAAADAEIAKIRRQSIELQTALNDLASDGENTERLLSESNRTLAMLEQRLAELSPVASSAKQRLDEALTVRDQVQRGLSLLSQQQSLKERRVGLTAVKPAAKSEKPRLELPSGAAHDFAQTVSAVLTEWQFPGDRHVSFDEATFDLKIDGKNRQDNGKGVRAIMHAAFKVALLLYCKERGLPHPGFLILDTPLLTYRDPLRSKAGPLAVDEQVLRNTSLKDFFFEHLSQQGDACQFLVIENVELPARIDDLASVETFTGDPMIGRRGLFYDPQGTPSAPRSR